MYVLINLCLQFMTYSLPPFLLAVFLFNDSVISLHEWVPLLPHHLKPATSQHLPLQLGYKEKENTSLT